MGHGGGKPWEFSHDGLLVTVRLTLRRGRGAIDGIVPCTEGGTALKARVRAAPSSGDANRALAHLLARVLGIAPGNLALVGWAASRLERLRVRCDPRAAAAILDRIGHAAVPG